MATLGNMVYTNISRLYHDRVSAIKVTAPENGIINNLNFYAKSQYSIIDNDVKGLLYASDGTLIEVIGMTEIAGSSAQWWTITPTGSPTIESGVTYWFGIVVRNEHSGNDYIDLYFDTNNPPGFDCEDTTNSYSSPQTFGPDYDPVLYSIYINYTPIAKVEGIKPGAIEFVSWDDVANVY